MAAEGPLCAPGGERGVYRSTDGGATWTPVLQIDENTGVTTAPIVHGHVLGEPAEGSEGATSSGGGP